MNQLPWNAAAKSDSIRNWAEQLHKESKRVFLADKTHVQVLFLFKDEGPVSVTPIPPKTTHEQIQSAIISAIVGQNLYGVIHVGEAWMYFRKDKKDHTAFQLLDGEMRVSDLKPEDRTEALYLKMESRDGDCLIYLNQIIRDGEKVELGADRRILGEDLAWFG